MSDDFKFQGYKEYLQDIMTYDGILRETVCCLLGEPKAVYRGGPLGTHEIRKYETITIFNEAGNIALHYRIDYHIDEKCEIFTMKRIKK